MTVKKRYYGLDEIGFIGIQEKQSNAKVKKDIAMTVRYIKAIKGQKGTNGSSKGK